ncbi:MAG: DUF3268 family zinc-finger domain-containing protein [Sedimentisphaerales bacterium]|nr:DUF3268 family zinc-finger domain-containing protein [Sedimentisphaerales bacterium]
MSKKPKIRCPKHLCELQSKKTRYGNRLFCPEPGCTVVCWDGGTSTPADEETRQARRAAHAAFDPLWEGGQTSKGTAYKQLSEYMGLPQKETHIGCFDIEKCKLVLAFCEEV